jgi:hypothetical protein
MDMPPTTIDDAECPSVLVRGETPAEELRPGWQRRLIRTRQLMTAVLDLDQGPWPEPPHPMRAGDLFSVPSNIPHTIQLMSRSARLIDTFHPIRDEFLPPGAR